jgi:hypothetical protein
VPYGRSDTSRLTTEGRGQEKRRRLLIVAVAIGLFVVLRRYFTPVTALIWGVCFPAAIAPLLVVALVFEIVRRRRWRALHQGVGSP